MYSFLLLLLLGAWMQPRDLVVEAIWVKPTPSSDGAMEDTATTELPTPSSDGAMEDTATTELPTPSSDGAMEDTTTTELPTPSSDGAMEDTATTELPTPDLALNTEQSTDDGTTTCDKDKEALRGCGWEACPAACTCDAMSKTVNCSGAGLTTVPRVAPSEAQILLLDNNGLVNMSGIESPVWCTLKTINADHNKLSSIIPADTVGSCTCFDWKEDQSCLPQTLQTLSLNHNQIKTLSPSDSQLLYSLRELHLAGNNVEHLEVSVCGPRELLEGVSCSDEGDGYVTPYANLRELDLSANQLVTFPPCIMKLMPNLIVLNVSHNSLREFCVNTSLSAIISLEHLDLSDNKLKVIQPLLTLAQVPSLKNLSFNNNPWDCSSELTKDLLICQTGNQHRGFFIVIVGILITVCLAMLFVHIGCRKITPNIYYVLGWLPSAKDDATFTRQYSVFVVHSWEDNDMVKTDLVDPLNELGFSVAWNENAFMPGDNLDASIEKAVVSSRRMLVVVSKYLETFPKGKQIIERGLSEECSVPGFKVVALVMDNLPRQMCSVLHNIVIKRTYVPRQSSNYISTIREFLPALALSDHVIPFTETDIQGFLLRQMEIRKRRDNERAQLQEVFPFQYLDPSGSSVNTSITIQEIGPVEDFDRTRSEWHSTRF